LSPLLKLIKFLFKTIKISKKFRPFLIYIDISGETETNFPPIYEKYQMNNFKRLIIETIVKIYKLHNTTPNSS